MANNRLYIKDTETGDKFLLAKSYGDGWTSWDSSTMGSRLNDWLNACPVKTETERRDMEASWGNCRGKTKLVIYAENDEIAAGGD